MEPTQALIDALRCDKIEAARRMTEEQRLVAGTELFDLARELTSAGIRMQYPDASQDQVAKLVAERMQLANR